MVTMTTSDLGIQEKFDYTYPYENINPEKKIEQYIPDFFANENIYYTPGINMDISSFIMSYPIHFTIRNEMEKEGLSIISFEEENIDGLVSLVFEVSDTEKNISQIEYEIIKKFNLNNKNISLTIF